MKLVFGELLVDHAAERGSVLHLFVAQPTPLEEKNLGKIFALIEFTEPFPFANDVVQQIDDSFFQNYYHSTDFEIEAAFERSLHKVNNAVQDVIREHGEDWVYKTNLALGVVRDSTLHLSYAGKVEAYLAQPDKMVDIIQQPSSSAIQPLKLFNTIVSGKCPEKCSLIIATATLFNYLSLEKVRRIVLEQSPAEAVQSLENVLSEHDTLSNIAAFVIKTERINTANVGAGATSPSGTTPLERTAFSNNQDSMEKLISQERKTDDLLTSSIWPNLKGRLKSITTQTKTRPSGAERSSHAPVNRRAQTSPVMVVWQYIVWGARWLARMGLQLLRWLLIAGKAVWRALKRFFRNPDSLSASFGGSVHGVIGWWRRLTLPRKLFLTLFALTVIIFAIALLRKDRSVTNNQQAEQYAQTITNLQNTLGEIESKQIMKDETGARALLVKAENDLATIPTDSAAYRANGEAIRQKIDSLNADLNKVVTLDQLTLVADFTGLPEAKDVGRITMIGNNIFGFAEDSETVYRSNLEDSTVTSGADSKLGYRSLENDSAATTLAYVAKETFVQFNPVLEKTSAVTVNLKDKVTVTDFDIFADRLYVLDATNKKIWRLERTGDTYSQSSAWLETTEALEQAVAFDIDGSIYVLLGDGQVKRYDSGQETSFKLDSFSPSLAGANAIVKTEPTLPFYILNPSTQRLVILETDGKLRAQYVNANLAAAKDLIVDEDKQLVYVLADNKVWSISVKTE